MVELRLFGYFEGRIGDRTVPGLGSGKAGELFGFLLLNRHRPLGREELATALWEEGNPKQLTKNYSHNMWILRQRLETHFGLSFGEVIRQSDKWLECRTDAAIWLDVEVFEKVHMLVKDLPGRELSAGDLVTLKQAAALYRGDLLLGWYQDWCLFERLRLQGMYLLLLDKLAEASESAGEYEQGIGWTMMALRYEPASERANRRLMRLSALAGNRTAALRQYQQHAQVLKTEFNARPEPSTEALYHQILEGSFDGTLPMFQTGSFALATSPEPVRDHLTQVQSLFPLRFFRKECD